MSNTKQTRIIVVTGAGGGQGGGIVRALLASDQDWQIRALTRNPNSSNADALRNEYPRELETGRLSFVQADAYDLNTLRPAFQGAYGVFAATSEIRPGKVLVEETDMLHEIEAGRNMVTAAKEVGVEHFVLSSLPDMVEPTGGRFTGIHHMNNKYAIEKIAKENLKAVTSLIPGFFYTNMRWAHYSRRLADGVVEFRTSFPSNQPAQWVDPAYDMGRFTARVFELGIEKTAGNTYLVMSPHITPEEMAATFIRVTGQPSIHNPITPAQFGELTAPFVGPAFQADAQQMMEWASIMPADKVCYGTMEQKKMDDSFNDLGLKASTWEEWLRRSGWKGPE